MVDEAFLTQKIGPLPSWEWIAIGVGGYFIYSHYLHKSTAAAVAGGDDTSTIDGNGNNAGVDDGSYAGDNVSDYSGGGTGYSGDTASLSGLSNSNQSWLLSSIDGLLGSQYDPADVTQALTDYVSGNPLTASERSIVSTAIGKFGAPPTPLTIVPTDTGSTDPSTSTPTPAPVDPVAPVGPGPDPVAPVAPVAPTPAPVAVAAPTPTQATPAQIARKEAAKASTKKAYDAALTAQNNNKNNILGAALGVVLKARVASTYAAYVAASNKPALDY